MARSSGFRVRWSGKNMIFEEFSGTVKIFPCIKIKIFQKSCFFLLTREPEVLALCLFYTIISVLSNAAE